MSSTRALDDLGNKYTQMMKDAKAHLSQLHASLPADWSTVEPALARRGWYPSLEVDLDWYNNIAELVKEGRLQQLDGRMAEVARYHVSLVRELARECYLDRYELISDGLEAHEQGKYSLSIPVMLAQADGICFEFLGSQLYSKESRLPRTRAKVRQKIRELPLTDYERDSDIFLHIVLDLLHRGTSIMDGTKVRQAERLKDSTYGPLNRHGVMHGTETDYTTEENSLRAVMIVHCIMSAEQEYNARAVAKPSA